MFQKVVLRVQGIEQLKWYFASAGKELVQYSSLAEKQKNCSQLKERGRSTHGRLGKMAE